MTSRMKQYLWSITFDPKNPTDLRDRDALDRMISEIGLCDLNTVDGLEKPARHVGYSCDRDVSLEQARQLNRGLDLALTLVDRINANPKFGYKATVHPRSEFTIA